jgi:nicotinate-nucleotide adenylyltransferase
MRIGVLGGAFDPVHYGHLLLAEQAREQARLGEVLFIPAARHPFKADTTAAQFDRRAEMLLLAVAGNDGFRVDEIEKERPGLSYTADTLEELIRRGPNDELFLLVGSDTLPDLPKWHDPARVVKAATLVVRERPGHPLVSNVQLEAIIGAPVRTQVIKVPANDVSSKEIRRRVAEGRSIRYLVPRAVEVYIREKGLYRSFSQTTS